MKGRLSSAAILAVLAVSPSFGQEYFRRGDVNASGRVTISDAVWLLRHVFLGGEVAIPCLDAANVNDDAALSMQDGVHILHFLFLGGDPPPAPFTECGTESTSPSLGCASFPPCEVGDSISFCCDVSGSMNEANKLRRLKDEVLKSVNQFSDRVDFGLVFFDSNLRRFPESGEPARATAENVEAARAFIEAVVAGHGTCSKQALNAVLDFEEKSKARRKVIIYMSDGNNTCPGSDEATYAQETLDEITTRNAGSVRINAICIGTVGMVNEEWMKQLAARNGGSYARMIF